MAKFNSVKKIDISDMPEEQRSWIGKLLEPINQFMTQTSTALSNGLVLADNSRSVKITATIAANQAYPMQYNLKALKEKPSMVLIGSLKTTDGTSITAAFSLVWTYNDGILSYTLLGLSASSKYEISLLAIL
jgi:hypothetical protein